MSADIEAMFLQVQVPPEDGEKINQTKYPRLNTLGIYLEPKTRQHVQIILYNVQPQTMRKNSQSLLEL